MIATLTRSEVRAVSRALHAAGFRLPKVGYQVDFTISPGSDTACVSWDDPYVRAVAADARGYYFIRGVEPFRKFRRADGTVVALCSLCHRNPAQPSCGGLCDSCRSE